MPELATPAVGTGAPPGRLGEFWRSYAQSRGALIGLALVVLLVLLALFADIVSPHQPNEQYREFTLTPPAWDPGGTSQFLLGTDPVGRDILSRLIHGTRLSLLIGVISVAISLGLGVVLGLVAGFFRGMTETVIMRVMDVMLALPSLLLAIAVVAILGPGLINAMYAIAIVLLPHYVRLTRAAVLAEAGKEYVASSRIAGAGAIRLMFATILPNCVAPLIVQATLGFSSAILDAAALGIAVDDVDLTMEAGEIVGCVGESGSGKSVTALALMGLVDFPGRVRAKRMSFDGRDLLGLSDAGRRALVGKDIAMIFQDPLASLNPC